MKSIRPLHLAGKLIDALIAGSAQGGLGLAPHGWRFVEPVASYCAAEN